MPRIIAIDYGLKRTGLAVTDPLQIISSSLETVRTHLLIPFLKVYFQKETVECIVLGYPRDTNMRETNTTKPVEALARKLALEFPTIPVVLEDERFTSKMAMQSMIAAGTTKAYRREKGNIDMVSATIILQSYLERKGNGFA